MAKLSAHGRELLRIEKRGTLDSGTSVRWTMVVCEDHVILEKSDFYNGGRLDFSSGWKRRGKLAASATKESWANAYIPKGWVLA